MRGAESSRDSSAPLPTRVARVDPAGREALDDKGHPGAQVCQPVDPARDGPATQLLQGTERDIDTS